MPQLVVCCNWVGVKTKEGLAVQALNNTKKTTTISLAQRQRGMSFIGLCMLAAIIVFLSYIGFKSVPVLTEYAAVQRALKKASEGSTVLEFGSCSTGKPILIISISMKIPSAPRT